MNTHIKVTSYKLRVTGCKLRVTGYELQVTKGQWTALTLCCLFLLIFSSCTKEKETEHTYPRVATGLVTNINAGGATFNGSFLQAGNGEIIDHGFVFDVSKTPNIFNSERISLGTSSGDGSFTAIADFGMVTGKTYYVSAYAQNKDKVFYAEPVEFVSKGGPSPEILSIIPAEGLRGDTVIIKGRHFSQQTYKNLVKFSDGDASVTSASDTALTVCVPANNGKESVDVFVTTAGKTAQKTGGFKYLKPVITEIIPKQAGIGDKITIKGQSFSTDPSTTRVSLGEYQLKINSCTKNEITVIIPDNLSALVEPITITIDNLGTTSTIKFEVISPWTKKKSLPVSGRMYSTGYTSEGFGYACFGRAVNEWWTTYYNDHCKYDLNENKWDIVPLIADWDGNQHGVGSRCGAVSFEIGEKVYVGYGSGGGNYTDFYQIDKSKWVMIAGSNPFILGWAAGFVCNDKAYIYDGGYSGKLWQFEPVLNKWTEKTNSLELGYRTHAISFSIDGKGYIGLGKNNNRSFSDILKYDPQTDKWINESIVYPGGAIYGAIVINIKNRIFIGLGNGNNRNIWEFFPENNSWKKVSVFPGAVREGAFVFIVNDKAYIGAGFSGEYLNDFYEFDPSKL